MAVCIFALAVGAVAAHPVAGSSAGPTATASKKCKKPRWKCAPKIYHLSASGVGARGLETFSVDVDLKKRRASAGEVDYTEESGSVTLATSYTTRASSPLTTCPGDLNWKVPQQTLPVSTSDVFDFDMFLLFDLLGSEKNTYSLVVGSGYIYGGSTRIIGKGTVTCPADGSSAPFDYRLQGAAVESVGKGKPGKRRITGSAANTRGESLNWTLTAK